MGRRVDRLLTHIRRVTENELANSTTDISDEEIIQYLNEGQQRLQAKIVAKFPRVFIKETTISAVQSQEEYSLPADCFLAGRIISIDYTDDTGADPAYFRLKPATERSRNSNLDGLPEYYIRQDKLNDSTGSFLASPRPSTSNGVFRVRYVQRIDNLDKRRGIISAVTLNSSTRTVTTLTLDTSGSPPIDSTELAEHDYICIVNTIGEIQMRNVRFDSINTTTGAVTVNSGFTYESGETAAVGNYIVAGKNASTHSKLQDDLERYLIQFSAYKIFKRDSSTDSGGAAQELMAMESEILESYSDINEDISEIDVVEFWE